MDSSPRSLGVRFQVGLRTRLGLCIQIAAPPIAVATLVSTSVHFAVDKLREVDDKVLFFPRSEREVENDLDVDRFYEHMDPNFTLTLADFIYDHLKGSSFQRVSTAMKTFNIFILGAGWRAQGRR